MLETTSKPPRANGGKQSIRKFVMRKTLRRKESGRKLKRTKNAG